MSLNCLTTGRLLNSFLSWTTLPSSAVDFGGVPRVANISPFSFCKTIIGLPSSPNIFVLNILPALPSFLSNSCPSSNDISPLTMRPTTIPSRFLGTPCWLPAVPSFSILLRIAFITGSSSVKPSSFSLLMPLASLSCSVWTPVVSGGLPWF